MDPVERQQETDWRHRDSSASIPPQLSTSFCRWTSVIDRGAGGLGTLRRTYSQPLSVSMAIVGSILVLACRTSRRTIVLIASGLAGRDARHGLLHRPL